MTLPATVVNMVKVMKGYRFKLNQIISCLNSFVFKNSGTTLSLNVYISLIPRSVDSVLNMVWITYIIQIFMQQPSEWFAFIILVPFFLDGVSLSALFSVWHSHYYCMVVTSQVVLPSTFVRLRVVGLQISCVNLFGTTEPLWQKKFATD